jgi:hypothetical protein
MGAYSIDIMHHSRYVNESGWVVEEGGLTPLINLLRSSNKRVQEESCITLRIVSANTDR